MYRPSRSRSQAAPEHVLGAAYLAAIQIADRLRLEKERISFGWLHRALASFDR